MCDTPTGGACGRRLGKLCVLAHGCRHSERESWLTGDLIITRNTGWLSIEGEWRMFGTMGAGPIVGVLVGAVAIVVLIAVVRAWLQRN
jgi:hypothetical protein